jgi:hypothetical protein
MKNPRIRRLAAMALGPLLGLSLLAHAQDAQRDPTVAPSATTGQPSPSPAGVEGMTVLVRDGKPALVVGTRQYAPGDMVGSMRLQRITEKEVWFHDGSAVIKVPRFAGIERKSLTAKPLCAATAKSPPSAVAACEDTQP